MKKDVIYLDNAATTKISDSVFEAMLPWLKDKYGNASSLHTYGREAASAIEKARKDCAECLNCSPKEIIFTSGATESDNLAVKSVMSVSRLGNTVVTSQIEHHAILKPLETMERKGAANILCPAVGNDGIVDMTDIKALISDRSHRPKLVSIMAVNNEIGTIQPIKEIGSICRERRVIFHTDAVQAIGNIPVDVRKMNIDMLSLSGHKIHAPKGIGLLYRRSYIPITPLIEGGGQENGKRSGTENVAAIVGLAEALKEATEGIEEKNIRLKRLEEKLIKGLMQIKGVKLNGNRDKKVPSICSFTFDGVSGEALMLQLDFYGICVSTGSACNSGNLEGSHVLNAIGLSESEMHSTVRFSMSKYTTEAEIDTVLSIVPKIVERMRD